MLAHWLFHKGIFIMLDVKNIMEITLVTGIIFSILLLEFYTDSYISMRKKDVKIYA